MLGVTFKLSWAPARPILDRAPMTIEIATYRTEHFAGVDALWRANFPDDPPYNRASASIPAKLAFQPDLFLVALDAGAVVGAIMAGYDGHRGWLYSVSVHRSHRRAGVGVSLVREAERRLRALGCIKINVQVRTTNSQVVAFYQSLGFEIEPRISLGKTVAADMPEDG
jgi:ribosomal protein S18 acetylase RimI-like enzyme